VLVYTGSPHLFGGRANGLPHVTHVSHCQLGSQLVAGNSQFSTLCSRLLLSSWWHPATCYGSATAVLAPHTAAVGVVALWTVPGTVQQCEPFTPRCCLRSGCCARPAVLCSSH
jgi:hypothetical protein